MCRLSAQCQQEADAAEQDQERQNDALGQHRHHAYRTEQDAIRHRLPIMKADGQPNCQRAQECQKGLRLPIRHVAQQHRMQSTEKGREQPCP